MNYTPPLQHIRSGTLTASQMTAYYACTFIRQNGELFVCNEDYHAENPNIFRHHEMYAFLKHSFITKGAWQSASGKRLDFGTHTSKKVAEMMIDGLGNVDELGIEGEMPCYMKVQPFMKKGGLPKEFAEKFVLEKRIQAVVSPRDPLHKEKLRAIGRSCAKTLLLFTTQDNETKHIRHSMV